jgi:CRISPR type I-E-associated protein CasB/Cse2
MAVRTVRSRFDHLERGKIASLRRCRTAAEIVLEGVYWQVVDSLGREQVNLSHVVLLFPLARHRTSESFSFGGFLRKQLGDSDGGTLRFRRVLDSRDRDELDHRMRGLLRLAARDGAAVDWGILGTDILWFFADSDRVRRRWAQDFYAPSSVTPGKPDIADLSSNP